MDFAGEIDRVGFSRLPQEGPVDEPMKTTKFLNPDALLDELSAACAPFGKVESIRLFCRRERPHAFFAMVHMDKGRDEAAEAIDGLNSEGVVCKLDVLNPEFRCHNRAEGSMLVASCNDCRWTARPNDPDR